MDPGIHLGMMSCQHSQMLRDGSPLWPEIREGDTVMDWDPRFSWADGIIKDRIRVAILNY